MINPSIKILLLNILIAIIIYVASLYGAFIAGYGANGNHLHLEQDMFLSFVIFHLIINLVLLYRFKKLDWIYTSVSLALIGFYYFAEAWQFGYF